MKTVIDNSHYSSCWGCEGKKKTCKLCNGTGKFKESHYYIITKDKKGRTIAFDSDGIN